MERISHRDLHALLDILQRLDGAADPDSFALHVLPLLQSLVPCEMITYNEVNPLRNRTMTIVDPAGALPADGTQRFEPHIPEHPLIRHYQQTRDGKAAKLSDFLSQRQFHALGLYAEFFREVGVEHQLAVTLPSQAPLVVGIAFNRAARDFSERDRAVVNLLRPHLVQAYSRAEANQQVRLAFDALERGLELRGIAVVLLSPNGRPPVMSAQARHWIDTYFDSAERRKDRLPELLDAWISVCRRQWQEDLIPLQECLIREHETGQLIVRFVSEAAAGGPMLLLLEQLPRTGVDASIPVPHLTPREEAVLRLVAEGATNKEIGTAAGISERTVGKHLEHVFAKLGVQTRTAAAGWALRNL